MTESPDAILIWNPGLDGASIALGVDAVSQSSKDAAAFRAAGIDEELGVGYVERVDGTRIHLTDIALDALSAALDCEVLVMNECSKDGHYNREYQIERRPLPEAAFAPGV